MAGSTPNLALYLPGGGSGGLYPPDEVADIAPINANFVTLDTWAGTIEAFRTAQSGRNQQYRGIAANIGLVAGMVAGDTYQETDAGKRLRVYTGSSWIAKPGEILTPTSVVNGTIQPSGIVTFSAAATVSLNGVFASGDFREYEIVFDCTKSVSGGVTMRLRAAGADNSASQYNYRRAGTTGAGYVEALNSAQNKWDLSVSSLTRQIGKLRVTDVAAAANSHLYEGTSYDTDGTAIGQTFGLHGDHRVASAFDGFTLFPASGTITGQVYVVGIS